MGVCDASEVRDEMRRTEPIGPVGIADPCLGWVPPWCARVNLNTLRPSDSVHSRGICERPEPDHRISPVVHEVLRQLLAHVFVLAFEDDGAEGVDGRGADEGLADEEEHGRHEEVGVGCGVRAAGPVIADRLYLLGYPTQLRGNQGSVKSEWCVEGIGAWRMRCT